MINISLIEIGWSGMDWIHLVRDRDHWRDLVNTVMDLRHKIFGKYLVAERLAASQEGLSSIESVGRSVGRSVS
jgi:hypothetical protein